MNAEIRPCSGALQTYTVYAARNRHLTGREHSKPTRTQGTVIAAAIRRQLHAVVTTGRAGAPHRRRRDRRRRRTPWPPAHT